MCAVVDRRLKDQSCHTAMSSYHWPSRWVAVKSSKPVGYPSRAPCVEHVRTLREDTGPRSIGVCRGIRYRRRRSRHAGRPIVHRSRRPVASTDTALGSATVRIRIPLDCVAQLPRPMRQRRRRTRPSTFPRRDRNRRCRRHRSNRWSRRSWGQLRTPTSGVASSPHALPEGTASHARRRRAHASRPRVDRTRDCPWAGLHRRRGETARSGCRSAVAPTRFAKFASFRSSRQSMYQSSEGRTRQRGPFGR